MATFTMPEGYRDTVPVSAVPTALPAFPKPHYAWPSDVLEWKDPVIYELLKWGQRKNVRVSHSLEYADIQDLIDEINLDFAGSEAQTLAQDIIPTFRLQLGLPDKMPHQMLQADWDALLQSVQDRCDTYWSAMASSNADEGQQPSAVMLNCIESSTSYRWYATWRNTWSYVEALTPSEKLAWDDALDYIYIEMAKIINAEFPGVPTMIYTNGAKSWDHPISGSGPLLRMPAQSASAWTDHSITSYRFADLEFYRRTAIIQIQGIDRMYTGEQQDFPTVLPPSSEFARPITPWINCGPDRGAQLEYRYWRNPGGDPYGSVSERLSYPYYESMLLNHSWIGTEYRDDNWRFWPEDRVERVCFWPRMWQKENTDWWLMARLCGANHIESDLILSDYDGYSP